MNEFITWLFSEATMKAIAICAFGGIIASYFVIKGKTVSQKNINAKGDVVAGNKTKNINIGGDSIGDNKN